LFWASRDLPLKLLTRWDPVWRVFMKAGDQAHVPGITGKIQGRLKSFNTQKSPLTPLF